MTDRPTPFQHVILEALREEIWESVEHDLDGKDRYRSAAAGSNRSNTKRQLDLMAAQMSRKGPEDDENASPTPPRPASGS